MFPKSVAGQPCEFEHSTCGGKTEGCQGQGPHGWDDFENTHTIGTRQAVFAQDLWRTATTQLNASAFGYVHTYVDMSNVTVAPEFTTTGTQGQTCPGGLGDAFAAGTTDGPGAFDFIEGSNATNTNEYWNWIAAHILAKPSKEVMACQFPKPILLYLQGIKFPCQWCANVLPLQLYQWGNFVMIGAPGEFTTMAGRRLRDTVKQAFADAGKDVSQMTFSIAGLSNSYSHYIATFEEYQIQRYAGASTLYGPHTLAAYQQEFYKLALLLAAGKSAPPGTPPVPCNHTFNFLPPVIEDTAPLSGFGSVVSNCKSSYTLGSVVNVTFWGSDLRNNLMSNSSYLTVETKTSSGTWTAVLNDADFETRLHWERDGLTRSKVTCSWHIPQTYGPVARKGATYRITLSAFHKSLILGLRPYTGHSAAFVLQ
jgi:neutral ceramidase